MNEPGKKLLKAASTLFIIFLGIPTVTLTFIGFVLPVLYIIGGSMNKKAV